MEIRALQQIRGAHGDFENGSVGTVPDEVGHAWEEAGIAENITTPAPLENTAAPEPEENAMARPSRRRGRETAETAEPDAPAADPEAAETAEPDAPAADPETAEE